MSETVKVESLRELDALVAEHVLGAEWWRSSVTGRRMMLLPEQVERRPHFTMRADGTEEPVHDWRAHTDFPAYSTDIAAAWEVVERMRAEGWNWILDSGLSVHEFEAELRLIYGEDGNLTRAAAATAPLAITLAALRAKGITVDLQLPESAASRLGPGERGTK